MFHITNHLILMKIINAAEFRPASIRKPASIPANGNPGV
jgi:hypothetical protein